MEIKNIVKNVLNDKVGHFDYKGVKIIFMSINKIESHIFENDQRTMFITWYTDRLVVSPVFSKNTSLNLESFLNSLKINEGREYTLLRISKINKKFNEWLEYAISEVIKEVNKTMVSYFEIYTDMFQRKKIVKMFNDETSARQKLKKEYVIYKETKVKTKDMRMHYTSLKDLLQAKNFIYSKKTKIIENEYVVEVSFLTLNNELVFGTGISKNYYKALDVALYEILERYCGITNYGKEWLCSALDLNVKGEIFLDPTCYFTKRGNEAKVYRTENIKWITSYNLTENKTVLMPKDFIFYKNPNAFIKSSSNGHALGNSMLEAIIHSIYELVERDLFLYYWHNKISPICINIDSINSRDIKSLIQSIVLLGYKVYIYELQDNKFLSVYWVYAEGKSKSKFATYSTAGAHKHNITAIKDALKECYFALYTYDDDVKTYKKEAKKMKEEDIFSVDDHPLYYSIEERKSKFDFLEKIPRKNLKSDIEEEIYLVDYYFSLIKYIEQNYGNIYIIKTTNNIASYFNLECVKVFLEEGNEMYFGYQNQNLNLKKIKSETLDIHPFP